MNTAPASKLLTPAEVAELIGCTAGNLARWRKRRQGPPYVVLTSRLVRYREADVQAWLASRVVDPTRLRSAR